MKYNNEIQLIYLVIINVIINVMLLKTFSIKIEKTFKTNYVIKNI